MSERKRRLELRLEELKRGRRRGTAGPELDLGRAARVARGELLAQRDERTDPLTGHRGVAEGLHLLARAGRWLVEMQLRDEAGGTVLRGQLLPAAEGLEAPAGAIVHLLAGGEAAIACVDSAGEFVLRHLPDREVERLLLELDDGVHELPWPSERAS